MIAVVGCGIAGLSAALAAAQADPRNEVLLLAKGTLQQSNTWLAQGGIAAVLPGAAGDSVESHAADTLAAGAHLGDAAAVQELCRAAAGQIHRLLALGTPFDRDPDGRLALGREAAHSARRILHVNGDGTGAGIAAAMRQAVAAEPRITVLEDAVVTSLQLDGGRISGLSVQAGGRQAGLSADAVVLAAGGAGAMYAHTTNPASATGDGVALAARAGAAVRDLEFFQFHPTSLDMPGNPLVSEAVRGEGAVLRTAAGHRFLEAVHPAAELAPRDVVSRAVTAYLRASGERCVWLDATAIAAARGPGYLAHRFPGLDALTRAHGLDWEHELLPVVPAAHYWMGGVATDRRGQSTVPGLYAAGENACTGVHGANRLASNSLLEGLVFGARAGAAAGTDRGGGGSPPAADHPGGAGTAASAADAVAGLDIVAGVTAAGVTGPDDAGPETGVPFSRAALQELMSAHAGVLRSAHGLHTARVRLGHWQQELGRRTARTVAAGGQEPAAPEDANLLTCARLLVAAALRRTESAGAHHRTDPAPPADTISDAIPFPQPERSLHAWSTLESR